jgi:hypothetical protein
MKVLVLYRPNSEFARLIDEFVGNFTRVYPDHRLELVDLNSKGGASKAEIYGIVRYPAIIALTNDGQLLKDWQGEPLPLMSEVAYYASA